MSTRGIELNLPDLPEVDLRLGAGETVGVTDSRPRRSALVRLWEAASTALPVLLMATLAVGSWWLVRNAAQPAAPRDSRAMPTDPDYTMSGVTLQRYGADGRLRLVVRGSELRHVPAADRLEIDEATVQVYSPQGSETVATARSLRTTTQAQEVQLLGNARVRGLTSAGEPALIAGEQLWLYPQEGRVRSSEPVRLELGAHVVHAAGMEYEHKSGQIVLSGPLRAQFAPSTPGPSSP